MHQREEINADNWCELSGRWGVAQDTMRRVAAAAEAYRTYTGGRLVHIISGARTSAEQARLRAAGRPTAPDELSTHLSCPATGVDISLGFGATREFKIQWGIAAVYAGLRWGGGSPVVDDLPSDWQHVDRGPRSGTG